MTPFLTEDNVEQILIGHLQELGYEYLFGPEIGPDGEAPERETYKYVVLKDRLHSALRRINPLLPSEVIDDAVRKVLSTESPDLLVNNRLFHRMLIDGVPVEYSKDGEIKHDLVWLIDRNNPFNNEWLAVNQYRVEEGQYHRRPDVVLFVNGLPLVVIELKNPADENATVKKAYNQLQTYKQELPTLFTYNAVMAISDGTDAKAGTLTSPWERFNTWRTIDGKTIEPVGTPMLEVMARGLFNPSVLLDYILHFIVFDDNGTKVIKKAAAYHQYHSVNKAVENTVRASGQDGDKRIGVIWHTQGSGKSLSMVFLAGKLVQQPDMENPTIVILTDRNDLDGQLFDNFAACRDLIRQNPIQAEYREQLRNLLTTASGGVVFTTIQKFMPEHKGDNYPLLSERRNIVVMADEAHRSQYDFIKGFARHMRDALPNASFIGFTGTPIAKIDKNTRAVFGEYIDIYDIMQAVEDYVTVPIHYEGRLAKIELLAEEKPNIDPEFEELTEGEELEEKEKLKGKWARLEAMVGTEKRIKLVAEDLVQHFEDRLSAMDGKGMIVCMSRRICVDIYKAIIALRPNWHNDDDKKGMLKVVMTGSASDPTGWQQHIRNKPRREKLATRFRDEHDPFKLVIVRDMWLTGFDAPPLHTMYVDKPMRGHGLMQAIARVNRVFKDKPGGRVVDYIGIADQLKHALKDYTESGGKGNPTLDQAEAVAVMLEKYDVVCSMYHGFDFQSIVAGTPDERLAGLIPAADFILSLDDGKKRYLDAVTALSRAFALSVPHDEAIRIRDDVGFFQAVKARIVKFQAEGEEHRSDEYLNTAVRQIVSKAIVSDEIVDVFAAAGLKKPDISILSDEFLQEVKGFKHKNLAVELLKKLLKDEIKHRSRKNVVEARSFAQMLEDTLRRYQNRTVETAVVIAELIELAKEMNKRRGRGEELGLAEDEVAFYDALEVNDSAVQVLGDDTLKHIAQELVKAVRGSVTIDWSVRENARARIRVIIKRILRKYGYPPDKQEHATATVLEQAEVLCQDVIAA